MGDNGNVNTLATFDANGPGLTFTLSTHFGIPLDPAIELPVLQSLARGPSPVVAVEGWFLALPPQDFRRSAWQAFKDHEGYPGWKVVSSRADFVARLAQ